jgi:hypothetical protein
MQVLSMLAGEVWGARPLPQRHYNETVKSLSSYETTDQADSFFSRVTKLTRPLSPVPRWLVLQLMPLPLQSQIP